MRNTTFLGYFKFVKKEKCNSAKEYKTEIPNEAIKNENPLINSKLDFQFIDLDKAFAN